jgi:hypothetical protein
MPAGESCASSRVQRAAPQGNSGHNATKQSVMHTCRHAHVCCVPLCTQKTHAHARAHVHARIHTRYASADRLPPLAPNFSLDDRYGRLVASRAVSGRAQQAVLALLLQLARGGGSGIGGGELPLNAIATYQPPRLIKPVGKKLRGWRVARLLGTRCGQGQQISQRGAHHGCLTHQCKRQRACALQAPLLPASRDGQPGGAPDQSKSARAAGQLQQAAAARAAGQAPGCTVAGAEGGRARKACELLAAPLIKARGRPSAIVAGCLLCVWSVPTRLGRRCTTPCGPPIPNPRKRSRRKSLFAMRCARPRAARAATAHSRAPPARPPRLGRRPQRRRRRRAWTAAATWRWRTMLMLAYRGRSGL